MLVGIDNLTQSTRSASPDPINDDVCDSRRSSTEDPGINLDARR
jgi:hypothetical protein